MSEKQYRLEENNQTNELILWEDVRILSVFKNSYDNRKHLNIIVGRLNEYQSTIDKFGNKLSSMVDICCEDYGTFCKIVEAVKEIIGDDTDE